MDAIFSEDGHHRTNVGWNLRWVNAIKGTMPFAYTHNALEAFLQLPEGRKFKTIHMQRKFVVNTRLQVQRTIIYGILAQMIEGAYNSLPAEKQLVVRA